MLFFRASFWQVSTSQSLFPPPGMQLRLQRKCWGEGIGVMGEEIGRGGRERERERERLAEILLLFC